MTMKKTLAGWYAIPDTKLADTKNAIALHMNACNPCTIGELIAEVRAQAYMSKFPQALHELIAAGFMAIDEETSESMNTTVFDLL